MPNTSLIIRDGFGICPFQAICQDMKEQQALGLSTQMFLLFGSHEKAYEIHEFSHLTKLSSQERLNLDF